MISFRASKTFVSSFGVLALLATLAGCAAQTTSAESATPSQESVATAAAVQGRGPQFRAGPEGHLLAAALREPSINLTTAQRSTIEGALQSMEPKGPPADMQARMTSLAAQVRTGNIDTTAKSGPSDTDRAARLVVDAKALETLHSTLTVNQRTALVAAVSKGGEHGERGEHGKHRGQRPEGKDSNGPREHAGKGHGDHGRMDRLVGDLDLTQAQKDAIHTKMEANKPSDADREAMKAKMQSFHAAKQAKLQTFASDSFDATAFVTPPADALNKGREDHMAKKLSVIVSVLDAAQREKLAAKLEQGPRPHSEVAPNVAPTTVQA
ncbi:MAG: hypothetical protein ABI461_14970, partial [Polyangiaceae bacterium]